MLTLAAFCAVVMPMLTVRFSRSGHCPLSVSCHLPRILAFTGPASCSRNSLCTRANAGFSMVSTTFPANHPAICSTCASWPAAAVALDFMICACSSLTSTLDPTRATRTWSRYDRPFMACGPMSVAGIGTSASGRVRRTSPLTRPFVRSDTLAAPSTKPMRDTLAADRLSMKLRRIWVLPV
ncbi:hypothetical protein D3C71_1469760 [compost metagenome]